MLNLPVPSRDDAADLQTAIEGTTGARKQHLRDAQGDVLDSYGRYEAAVLGSGSCPAAGMSVDAAAAMRFTYDALRTRVSLRAVREGLIGGEIQDSFCPMCTVAKVATLDHYVPRSKFPEFAILSLNLVPACGRCNLDKGNVCGEAVEDAPFIHPYLHVLPAHPVVHADVTVAARTVFATYAIRTPPALPERISNKLIAQAKKLGTLRTMERAAKDELVVQATLLASLHEAGGAATVSDSLSRTAADLAARWGVNHWRSVLHAAMARNGEFCDGGFKVVSPTPV